MAGTVFRAWPGPPAGDENLVYRHKDRRGPFSFTPSIFHKCQNPGALYPENALLDVGKEGNVLLTRALTAPA